MVKYFINLTNGIEQIPHIPKNKINFIRIQSTTLERKNWYKLFSDLDNNLLMWLALGMKCKIYDFGTNRKISKTIYLGLPIIEYCLNKFWMDYEAKTVMVGRKFTINCKDYVEKEIYQRYFIFHDEKSLQAKINLSIKFKYYKKYVNKKIQLVGISHSTSRDSDVLFYKNILNKFIK
jgi:hypothetical protein